jgi:peptide/nickel transport system substrate-binding protein
MKKLLLLTVLAALMVFALTACIQRAEEETPVDTPTPAPAVTNNEPAGTTPTDPATPADEPTEEAPVFIYEGAAEQSDALAAMNAVLARFPQYFDNPGEHVAGATFRQGMVATSPIPGSFGGAIFHDSTGDAAVADLLGASSSLLSQSAYYTFGQDGVATWEYDLDNNTFTLHMQHDVYWHDGVPLTLADLVFTYYTMANPDYAGIRFSTNEQLIIGIMDYHNGYADHIEGLVLSNNDRTLTFHFESMNPAMLYFGIWTSPMPQHIFESIPVSEMPTSDAVLVNPIGWGPFMIQNIVPGESVVMVRNENYVWGTPYIEELIIERIADPSLVPVAMETGRFDAIGFPTQYFEDYQNPTNFTFLGSPTVQYDFVAFRLGHWDFDEGRNVFTPERYMNNVYLRRAMAMAIDFTLLGEELFSGLRFAAGSFMPPHHGALMDLSLPGFPYNPELANQILDDAGFPVGADGYRTWPNGDDLTVIWAHPSNPATEHIIVPFYTQSWAEIGVRVELWRGRTHDLNSLWDYLDVDGDDDEIHIYTHGWSAGFNPNPSGRWGHAFWNPSRYTSERFDELLENLSDPRTFDPEVMRRAYAELQAYWQDVVPHFPTLWGITLTAVNNRVANWDTRVGTPPQEWGIHTVRLLAAEPYSR